MWNAMGLRFCPSVMGNCWVILMLNNCMSHQKFLPYTIVDCITECHLFYGKVNSSNDKLRVVQQTSLISTGLPLVLDLTMHTISYYAHSALDLCCCTWLSPVVVSRGYSSLQWPVFLLWWLLLLQSTGCGHVDFSSCSMGSVVVAHGLSCSKA